jgi:tetratricopeptide (TPR) repeat protein
LPIVLLRVCYSSHREVRVEQAAVDATQRLADPIALIRTRHNLAGAYAQLGRYTDAHTELGRALDLATRAGDHTMRAHTHLRISVLWGLQDRSTEALDHARQAFTRYEAAGHRAGQADALNQVGYAHQHLGHHAQAVTCYRHALDLFHGLGDRYGAAGTLTHLGDTHHTTGDHDAARIAWQQALTVLEDLDHPDAEPVRTKLAALDALAGRPTR